MYRFKPSPVYSFPDLTRIQGKRQFRKVCYFVGLEKLGTIMDQGNNVLKVAVMV